MSLLTRTEQKFLSLALSSLWKLIPGLAGLTCKSNAVVLTAFCSSPVSRARLSVKVSAIRNSIYLEYLYSIQDRLNEFIALRRSTLQPEGVLTTLPRCSKSIGFCTKNIFGACLTLMTRTR